MMIDPDDGMFELDETNNTHASQFVWRPTNLVFGTLTNRPEPPPRTADWNLIDHEELVWYNCDAMRTPTFKPSGTSSYWGAVAMMPGTNSDVDLDLHYWSTGAKNGFADPLATSRWSRGASDFLLMNFRNTPVKFYDVGVLQGGYVSGEDYHMAVVKSRRVYADVSGLVGAFTMDATELLDIYEINITQPGLYHAELVVTDPSLNLGFSLYGPDFIHGGKSDTQSESSGAWLETSSGRDEFNFPVLPDETGLHCLAVWKVGASDVGLTSDYTLWLDFEDVSPVGNTDLPTEVRLVGIHPNPFNPSATITFELPATRRVDLMVYDISGRMIRTLLNGETLGAGRLEAVWNGRDERGRSVSAGVYFCRLVVDGFSDTRRMVLVK